MCRVQRSGQWPFEVVGVITDRPCGAERIAQRHGLNCIRVDAQPGESWTARAASVVSDWKANVILLLLHRKIGPELWRDSNCAVWNLHPSLLPEYPGLDALQRNYEDAEAASRLGVNRRLGATIHVVTDRIDAGPIISQRSFTFRDAPELRRAQHICFLLKVALVLEAVCKWVDGALPHWSDNNAHPWHERSAPWKPHDPIADALAQLAEPWAMKWLEAQAYIDAARTEAKAFHA